ncbi:hypothetical protein MFMK1_000059 [Metallumcola ferriviriculae]|uniref:Cbb3-type cytochrome c oxidase subunit 3 n=1 Tax=Metallumcola ferriviriculae TaxID=3039180 RepID=A0AAU0UJA8_9FIRM|nr:hypothetical protein MFMK1_000059 [Desulfitibacteraceae bacterium MK1]
MIWGTIFSVGVIVALVYYFYRQNNDPGIDLFFANRLPEEGKRFKRNKQAEPVGEAEPYPNQGPQGSTE